MGGRRLSHGMRLELYRRVLELREGGASYRAIQRAIKEEYGVRISRSHISYWVRGLHTPDREPYNIPDLSKRGELAWVAGVYVGDGSIKVNRKGRFLSLKVKDRELAEVAARKLAVVMGRERPYAVGQLSDGRYYVQVQSRELADILLDRRRLLDLLEERPVEFIQAFFDCEGYASGLVSGQGSFIAKVGAANTDHALLERIGEKLAELKVFSKIYTLYPKGKVIATSKGRSVARRDCYQLHVVRQESIVRFHREVGFVTPRKREKLRDIVDILETLGTGREAAVEWVRRYKYRLGGGRERWFRRRQPLSWSEAEREYERIVAWRRSERDQNVAAGLR